MYLCILQQFRETKWLLVWIASSKWGQETLWMLNLLSLSIG